MSILLDALKKSEQQRLQGAAANAPPPAHGASSTPVRSRPWLLVTLLALIAAILAALLWRHYGQPGTEPVDDAPVAGAESPGPAPSTAEAEPPAAPSTPKTLVEELPATPPADPDDTAAQTSEESRAELGRSFKEYRADPPAAPAWDADAIAAPQPATDAAEPPPGPTPPSGSSPEPRASGPISYWELPQSVRDGLPELHITVLVYAERPEDRFVLVGGQRMGEGHDVGGGLVLEEIRRDGAVFSYRKYRFLVKG